MMIEEIKGASIQLEEVDSLLQQEHRIDVDVIRVSV